MRARPIDHVDVHVVWLVACARHSAAEQMASAGDHRDRPTSILIFPSQMEESISFFPFKFYAVDGAQPPSHKSVAVVGFVSHCCRANATILAADLSRK
jgi:hypothetical protein